MGPSKTDPKWIQTLQKSSPNPPRTLQNRAKIHPKGLLDPILDLCLKKGWFRTPKKTAPKRLEVLKRRPRPSQPPPKWSPRRSQIHFLKHFVAFFLPFKICIGFSSFF